MQFGVSLVNLLASKSSKSLKSLFRRLIHLLSLGFRDFAFLGFVPNTIIEVLIERGNFSPFAFALTSPKESQHNLYTMLVIPSVPGAAFRFASFNVLRTSFLVGLTNNSVLSSSVTEV